METNDNRTLFAEERKNKILELLRKKGKVLVPDLCETFNVSPATTRNDLNELEKTGLLKRTHGGAINISRAGFEPDYQQRGIKNLEQKEKIAKKALEYVDEGDIILLDTGTTTLQFSKMLKSKKNITIVVNDTEIARELEDSDDINVILIGGNLRRKFHCTVGPIATQILNDLNVDKAFMATNGISLEKGLTTPDLTQAEVKEIMIKISSEVILLCDSSKFGKNSFARVDTLSNIDRIITDDNIDREYAKELESLGIDVVIAK